MYKNAYFNTCMSSFEGVGLHVDNKVAAIATDPAFVYTSERLGGLDGLTQSMRNLTCEIGEYQC